MSAHCDVCGSGLVFGTGEDWQLMTCQLCECRELLAAAERRAAETEAALRKIATQNGGTVYMVSVARAALSAGGPERTTT